MKKLMTILVVLCLTSVTTAVDWGVWPTISSDAIEVRFQVIKGDFELCLAPRHDRRFDTYEVTVEKVNIGGSIFRPVITADLDTDVDVDLITDLRLYGLYSFFRHDVGDFYGGAFAGMEFDESDSEWGVLLGARINLHKNIRWGVEGLYLIDKYQGQDRDDFEIMTGPQFVF